MKRSRMPDRTGEIARTSSLRTKQFKPVAPEPETPQVCDVESWRSIVGMEGRYEVSDQGRVRAVYAARGRLAGRFLTPQPNSNGYLRVKLSNEQGARPARFVHHLVIEAFVGPRNGTEEVRHLDGNKFNNHPSNLAWGTRSQNMYDRVRHGTHHMARKTHCAQGHPYEGHNLMLRGKTGTRVCRECRNIVQRARRARRRNTGPIKAKRPSQSPEEREAKRFTRGRSQGWCEMRVPGVCLGRAREFSHRWAEGQGGPWCASNGLDSCGLAGCHGWLHRNPIEAKRLGWVIAPTFRIEGGRRLPVPTTEFPAHIWLPGWDEARKVWLTNDGQYLDTPPSPLSDYQQKGA